MFIYTFFLPIYYKIYVLDIDECDIGNHNCSILTSECINTEGSYECRCFPGYVLDQNSTLTRCNGECRCRIDNILWI